MGRKRKDGSDDDDDNNSLLMERREMMKLTKVAKSWDFTCTFCFKKFPSAQAMGGHQNAHRGERSEEKRLSVRDPIAYRKRAFLRAIKAHQSSAGEGGSSSSSSFYASTKMVKNDETNYNNSVNNYQRSSCKESSTNKKINDDVVMMNKLLAPKEKEMESVDEREKACIQCSVGGYGINFDHNLDLTLKL